MRFAGARLDAELERRCWTITVTYVDGDRYYEVAREVPSLDIQHVGMALRNIGSDLVDAWARVNNSNVKEVVGNHEAH